MKPTINSFSGADSGLEQCSGVEQFNVMLRTDCEGLVLNHPPLVVAVASDDDAVPKEGNSGSRRGKADAGFLHRGEDAPPSILIFFREDIIEDVLQCLPLKPRGSAIAESLIDLRKGRDKFRAAEAVCQLKESDVIGGDGVVVVIDSGHNNPFPLLSQGRLCYICC